jgi:hypothetical protein
MASSSLHLCRDEKCRHIFAVEISFALRKQVEVARIAPFTDSWTNLLLALSV